MVALPGASLELSMGALRFGVLAVFLFSCIGYPSQSGYKPEGGRSQAWDALHYASGNAKSLRYETQKEFTRIFRDAPGIVLSDIDPPYLNAILPKLFVITTAKPALALREARGGSTSREWPRPRHSCVRSSIAFKRCR
jgi:hypothetical protein